MSSEFVSDAGLKAAYCRWMKQHSILPDVPGGYLDNITLPDVPLVYSQSFVDENGDVISLFRGTVTLKASFSRTGKEEHFTFTKVVRTFADLPDLAPDEAGYILDDSY